MVKRRTKGSNLEEATAMVAAVAAPDVAREAARWLAFLGIERRLAPKTCEAYARDVSAFLAFLTEHLGGKPKLTELAKLSPADVRAWLSHRRRDGIEARTLVRALAATRSFARFLEREGKGKVAALSAVRAPRVPRSLPKPLTIGAAKAVSDPALRSSERREPWVLMRDAAVLALLYGSGLRISEALGLKRRDVPKPGAGDALTVLGKGNKTRMVPVLVAGPAGDRGLRAALPVRSRARRADLPRHQGTAALAAHRAARDERNPRRPRPAAQRDAACAAPFLRDASVVARRRSARDTGTARPRVAFHHADLYRGRFDAADRGLQGGASARARLSPCEISVSS